MFPGLAGLAGYSTDDQGTQFGALVRNSGPIQSISSGVPAALDWDTEAYDTTGWHSGSSARLTTPTNGASLVRVQSNLFYNQTGAGIEVSAEHHKNGLNFRGMGKGDALAASGSGKHLNIITAPIAVNAGDYFDTTATIGTGSYSFANDEENWFAVEKLDPTTKYALVYHNTTTALSAGATTQLAWNSEVADTSAFHDNVTNNSRLTVPATVTLVRLSGNAGGGSVAGRFILSMFKNGASARGLAAKSVDTTNEENANIVSAPLVVTTGDYFELNAASTNATTVPASEHVWFAIEEVPSTIKRALVHKSAGTQTFTAATPGTVSWDAEVYDTDSMHDNATNNSRLTVPAGCTKARVSFSLVTSSATGTMQGWVFKNAASDFFGMPSFTCDTVGGDRLSAMGAWVDVVPGDYFQVGFVSSAGCTLGTDNETWFCLECQ
jgi:hypothetical protein